MCLSGKQSCMITWNRITFATIIIIICVFLGSKVIWLHEIESLCDYVIIITSVFPGMQSYMVPWNRITFATIIIINCLSGKVIWLYEIELLCDYVIINTSVFPGMMVAWNYLPFWEAKLDTKKE